MILLFKEDYQQEAEVTFFTSKMKKPNASYKQLTMHPPLRYEIPSLANEKDKDKISDDEDEEANVYLYKPNSMDSLWMHYT